MSGYKLLCEKIADASAVRVSYGVILPDGGVIRDITDNENQAHELVRLMNENGVEPCHAGDVIADFLFGITTLEIKFYE